VVCNDTNFIYWIVENRVIVMVKIMVMVIVMDKAMASVKV